MKRILFALMITTSFISCKKGQADFILKGTLMDETFSTYLEGAKLQLFELEAGSLTPQLILSETTGSDGNYSFTFPRDKTESFQLRITKDNYFSEEIYFSLSDLSIEEDNIRNYSIAAKSWVNLKFVNTGGAPTDVLKYIKQQGKVDCTDCCPASYQYLNGAIDTSIYCINDGNTVYSYFYSVQNTLNQGERSIVTTPFDTVELLLSY